MTWKAANKNNLPSERVDSSSVGNSMPADKAIDEYNFNRHYFSPLSFSIAYSFTSLKNRRVKKSKAERIVAISNRSKATATPIAPVFQIVAAAAVPLTLSLLVRIEPPPINPIP